MERRKFIQMAGLGCAASVVSSGSRGLSFSTVKDLLEGDTNGQPLLVLPDEGVMTTGEMMIKVPSSAMSGHFSIMHGELDGLQLLPPHTHSREDQAVYVLNGALSFEFAGDGQVIYAPAGSYVIKPRHIQHAFWNPGHEKVHYIEFSTEDGFEGYVRDAVGPESLPLLALKYAVTHNLPDTARLVKQHGLTSVHRMSDEQFNELITMPV